MHRVTELSRVYEVLGVRLADNDHYDFCLCQDLESSWILQNQHFIEPKFWLITLTFKYNLNDEVKKNQMGRACSTNGGEECNVYDEALPGNDPTSGA
jgi:hypothetical protein